MKNINEFIKDIADRFEHGSNDVRIESLYLKSITTVDNFITLCNSKNWECENREDGIFIITQKSTHILLYLEYSCESFDSRDSSSFGSANNIISFWKEKYKIGTLVQVMKEYNKLKGRESYYKDLKLYELNMVEP